MKLIQKEWSYNCNPSQFLYNLDLVQREVRRLYTSIVYFMKVLYFALKKQCPSFNNWKMDKYISNPMSPFQFNWPCIRIWIYTRGQLVFKGGYHAWVQKHGKGVVSQGEERTTRVVFRVSKTAKIKKKRYVFSGLLKYEIRVCFLPAINTGLGYDFEPISLIRVWYFAEFKILVLGLGYEKFVKILV